MARTLAVQEIRSDDPAWAELIRVWREANTAHSKTIEGLRLIAHIYRREAHRWPEWLTQHGIRPPRRGPTSRSPFHGLLKHLLGLGNGADDNGDASRLAAILDRWLAEDIADDIGGWIGQHGSISRIYGGVPGARA